MFDVKKPEMYPGGTWQMSTNAAEAPLSAPIGPAPEMSKFATAAPQPTYQQEQTWMAPSWLPRTKPETAPAPTTAAPGQKKPAPGNMSPSWFD